MDNSYDEILRGIVPEIIDLLERRYNILRAISYNQPIGRRLLAEYLSLGERIIRGEIDFLKKQRLLYANEHGVSLSPECELLMDNLGALVHKMKGLASLEKYLANMFNISKVIVVPGNADECNDVLNEMGKAAGVFVREILEDNFIVSVTGGTTMAAIANNIPQGVSKKDVLVLPARGGMGEDLGLQSNTIAASMAKKLFASYRLLHVPDYIQDGAFEKLFENQKIEEIINLNKKANVLLHGIGIPEVMAERRDIDYAWVCETAQKKPVGEAFGNYFDEDGSVVFETHTVGPTLDDLVKIDKVIAVAGGKSKAKAIMAVLKGLSVDVLIIDQGAAEKIK